MKTTDAKGIVSGFADHEDDYGGDMNTNLNRLSAMASESFSFDPIASHDLVYAYRGGVLRNPGTAAVVIVGAGTVSLNNGANYIEVSDAGAITVNAYAFSIGNHPMAAVFCTDGAVTSVADRRVFLEGSPSRRVFDVTRYGGDPSGNRYSDDAFANAIADAHSETVIRARANGDVGAASGSAPIVWVPRGFYKVRNASLIRGYTRIHGEYSYIFQSNDAENIFDSYEDNAGYQNEFCALHLIGGRTQIRLVNGNIDTGMNRLHGITHSANDVNYFAIELACKSNLTAIDEARVLTTPRYLKAFNVDNISVKDSWINGYAENNLKPEDSESFLIESDANSILRFDNVLLVPEAEGDTTVKTRWMTLKGAHTGFVGHKVQFGGENAGLPLAYLYNGATATIDYPYSNQTGFVLRDSQGSCGRSTRADRGIVVAKTGIPHRVKIDGVWDVHEAPVINTSQMIDEDDNPITLEEYLGAVITVNHPKFAIEISGVIGQGTTYVDDLLLPYTSIIETVPQGPNLHTIPALKVNGPATAEAMSALSAAIKNALTSGVKSGGESLKLLPGDSADCAMMGFYPRSSAPNSRKGFMGFTYGASNDLEIVNQILGGLMQFGIAAGGRYEWYVDGAEVMRTNVDGPSAALRYNVSGTQVVGARGAPVADAMDAPTVITQLNALLARLRAHGLIAT